MQGRVYRRGTGWAFKVDLPRDPATGQRRQRQKGGFATRKAAEEGLTDLLGEIRTDVVAGTGTTKLEVWLTEWLAAVKPSLRPSTYSLYSTAVTSWITPRIGALKLAEVTPQVVQRLYTDLATSGGRSGKGSEPPLGPAGPPGAAAGVRQGSAVEAHGEQPTGLGHHPAPHGAEGDEDPQRRGCQGVPRRHRR